MHPHRRVGALHAGRLTHLHDGGLDEAQAHHVTPHATHRNAVAHGEGVAAQDHEIPGDGGHHLLQREGEAGGDQAESGGQAGGVAEPDRQEAQDKDHGGDEADALARPEPGLHRGGLGTADQQARPRRACPS